MKKSTLGFVLSSLVCLSVCGGSFDAMNTTAAVAVPVQKNVIQPVKLTFSPVEITREIRKVNVPASALPLTPEKSMRYLMGAEKLLKTEVKPVGTILLYSKQADRENFYAAFLTKNVLYDLGEIGTLTSLNLTQIKMETLAKTPVMRISGVFGANVVETTYIYMLDTEPRPLLVVEGHLKERDLDGDGFTEIVASIGTPEVTKIYKYIDGRYQVAELNSQLHAVAVQPNAKDPALFDVYYEGQTRPVTFRYANGTLQPVSR